MIICQYVCWYALFALLGWVFECVLNVLREGAWENRGFLFGPSCPIYGVGVAAFLFAFDRPLVADGTLPLWGVFIIAMFSSAILEYLTSVALERAFHTRWWDYSNMPLNLNGRICLPASLLFGACGVATAVFLVPLTHLAAQVVPPLVFEALALVITVVITIDGTLSFSALTQLLEKVELMASRVDEVMDSNVETLQRSGKTAAAKITTPLSLARIKFQLANALTFGRMTSVLPASRQDATDQMREFINGLTARQRRVMASIKGFSSKRATAFGYSARKAMHALSALGEKGPGKGTGAGGEQ